MKRTIALFSCFYLFLSVSLGAQNRSDYDKYWPQWRGPLATGVAPHANPPIEWSENQNIRWKIHTDNNRPHMGKNHQKSANDYNHYIL